MDTFYKDLLKGLNYSSNSKSLDVAFKNIKNKHPLLDENNLYTLAYLACQESTTIEDKNVLIEKIKNIISSNNNELY